LVCDAGWLSLDLGTRAAGNDSCGRLSLLTFFGEAKKVSGCRAAPGKPSLIEERTASTTQATRNNCKQMNTLLK